MIFFHYNHSMDSAAYHASEQALVEINIQDMLISFGIPNLKTGRGILARLLDYPARKFARHVLDYDQGVAQLGLAGGAARLLRSYVRSLTVNGHENLPQQGAVLILTNHPGMTDTVALFAALPRPDLRVLAADRSFLRALPATRQYLFFISDEGNDRLDVLRKTAAHLRAGGAVLTFPAGRIEPDPLVMPGAVESLLNWSSSAGFFIRMLPGLPVLPVIVSGVIAAPALRHPLTRLRRQPKDRERLAATLQILVREFFPSHWPVDVQVDIFPPIDTTGMAQLRDPQRITAALIEHIRPHYQRVSRKGLPPAVQTPSGSTPDNQTRLG